MWALGHRTFSALCNRRCRGIQSFGIVKQRLQTRLWVRVASYLCLLRIVRYTIIRLHWIGNRRKCTSQSLQRIVWRRYSMFYQPTLEAPRRCKLGNILHCCMLLIRSNTRRCLSLIPIASVMPTFGTGWAYSDCAFRAVCLVLFENPRIFFSSWLQLRTHRVPRMCWILMMLLITPFHLKLHPVVQARLLRAWPAA